MIGRTPSPFLKAGESNGAGKDIARTASPLSRTDSAESKPAASRITHSAALKKGTTGARKTNVLGAKKAGSKLGAKKVTTADIDFDEAEKKAREEAERIEKLGYNPDEEEAETKKAGAAKNDSSNIVSPTPVSPPRGGYGSASHTREKSASEVERLGMGMGRLGFGQIGGNKPAAQKKAVGGFGSVGPIKASSSNGMFSTRSTAVGQSTDDVIDDGENYARSKFGNQKGISSDEFFGKGSFDPNAQAEAKTRLQGFEGATAISSNAYFGRPEEEDNGEDYGDLESAAKDFVRKFGITAGDDLENLTQVLGEGATKLQGAIRSYLGN